MAITHLTPIRLPNLSAAPGSPAAGTIYFDTDDNAPYIYNGSTWVAMSAASAPVPRTVVAMDMSVTGRYGGSNTGTASARSIGTSGFTLTTGTSNTGRADVIMMPLGGGSAVWQERNPMWTFLCDRTTDGTEFDLFYGLCNSTATITNAASIATTGWIVGFMLERRASVSTWKVLTNDGTTPSTTTFSGPNTNTDALFTIVYDAAATAYKFYYNGTLVATHTIGVENAPAVVNLVAAHAGITNRTTSANSTARIAAFSYSQDLY